MTSSYYNDTYYNNVFSLGVLLAVTSSHLHIKFTIIPSDSMVLILKKQTF